MSHTFRRAHLPVLFLLLTLVLGGCGVDARLEKELTPIYGAVIVSRTEEAHDVWVSFLNSPFAERADADRRKTARKVAEHVRDHDPSFKTMDKVIVGFMTRKETETSAFRRIAASYTFTRAELGPPRPARPAPSTPVPNAAAPDSAAP
jgi:hypothetical protein